MHFTLDSLVCEGIHAQIGVNMFCIGSCVSWVALHWIWIWIWIWIWTWT